MTQVILPPTAIETPKVLSIVSLWSDFWAGIATSAAAPVSSTGNAANEAIYVPFQVTSEATFTRGFWYNGSVATNAGNVCVGIYDEAGVRRATTGAVAASGDSIIQSAAFAASATLASGRYYMAISFSASGANSTFAYAGVLSTERACGLYRQAVGAHPLPDPATFATMTQQVVPFFGIAQTSFAI